MRGTQKDEKRWKIVKALLELNPNVTYARIGREVGYKGQNVGVIAKTFGLPPRTPGGFQKKDDTPLIYPPWMQNASDEAPEAEGEKVDEGAA
jgi:hypothetical protein